MATWCAVFAILSRMDWATTGLGTSGDQSAGARFEVKMIRRPARSVISP
jgi:hypothetical protein